MKLILIFFSAILLSASTLNEAIEILKKNNLEIKSASLDIKAAEAASDTSSGANWGKLGLTQDIMNSNNAANVFGFKLTSREATFGDFGFGASNMPTNTSPAYLTTPPNTLNHPDARTFFQTKLKYEIPLFTGFQISSYTEILNSLL